MFFAFLIPNEGVQNFRFADYQEHFKVSDLMSIPLKFNLFNCCKNEESSKAYRKGP